nr:tetratricopeptide repeat protein [Thiohalobacter sp. COW1]
MHQGSGRQRNRPAPPPSVPARDRLDLNFFQRLFTPAGEEALVDGCRALALGDEAAALKHLRQATSLADGAFLAGFLALKHKNFDNAIAWLNQAVENSSRLGRYFAKYGMAATLSLPITEEVTAHLGPNRRGVWLGLAEAHQGRGEIEAAIAWLEQLRRKDPEDIVARLSLAELLLERDADDRKTGHRVVKLAQGIDNESELHATLLLYKARALRGLGMLTPARDALTLALRRKKDRPEDLLQALRFERAEVYAELGHKSRARREWEKLYAGNPDYAGVAERLGICP